MVDAEFEDLPGTILPFQRSGTAVTRGLYPYLSNMPIATFPGNQIPSHCLSCLSYCLCVLVQSAIYGAAFENHLEVAIGPDCSSVGNNLCNLGTP